MKGDGPSSRRLDYPDERDSELRPPFSPLLSRSAMHIMLPWTFRNSSSQAGRPQLRCRESLGASDPERSVHINVFSGPAHSLMPSRDGHR